MKVLKNIIIFSITLLLILLLGEFYLRFAAIQDCSNNKLDKRLGRIRRSNFNYTKLNEGFSISNFNKCSYIGKYYPKHKPKNTIRIALIGDSYVEGFQVFERNHFKTILENELNNIFNKEVQVLNFGRSGLGLENIYALDSLYVREFDPDYVLYFISNSDFYSSTNDPLIPSTLLKNGDIVIDNKFSQKAIRVFNLTNTFLQHSSFLSMLNNSRKVIFSDKIGVKLFEKFYPDNLDNIESNPINNKQIPPQNIEIIKTISNDKKIIIVNRSDNLYNKEISNLLLKHDISPINLSVPIKKLYNKGIDPHYWKATNKRGHWNNLAHREIGIYLSQKLQNIITSKTMVSYILTFSTKIEFLPKE